MRHRGTFVFFSALLAVALAWAEGAPPPAPEAIQGPVPRNVILMIGDGMGLAHLSAARYHKGKLEVEDMEHTGFNQTHSLRNFVTDSSAGGTALATGYLIVNGEVGIAPDGSHLKTVLEYAEEAGKWTGLVVTSRITHATPASMVAHVKSRGSEDEIALQIAAADVEVLLGGGWDKFLPERTVKVTEPGGSGEAIAGRNGGFEILATASVPAGATALTALEKPLLGTNDRPYGTRKDHRNLVREMEQRGYRFVRTAPELALISSDPPGKLLGLFHSGPLPKVTEGRSPSLSAMVLAALRILSQSPKGFFLMIEGSQIDWGGHDNDFDYTMHETADFDTAVGTVLRFLKDAGMDGETLVVVTADHETGGLSLHGHPTLPRGFEPKWSTKGHTGLPVPVFSQGPGAALFSGITSHAEIGRNLIERVAARKIRFDNLKDGSYPAEKAAK